MADIDIDVLAQALRNQGHTVGHLLEVPANAGGLELTVDGTVLTLAEARQLLVDEQPKE